MKSQKIGLAAFAAKVAILIQVHQLTIVMVANAAGAMKACPDHSEIGGQLAEVIKAG